MAIKFLSDVETTSSSTLSIGEVPNPGSAATKFLVAYGSANRVGQRTAQEMLSDLGVENSYLQTLSFDTSTGVITASVLNENNVTVDIDGRYVEGVTGTAPIVSSGGLTPAISLANTAVTAGNYTSANISVDAQGRITAAANGSSGGTNTNIANANLTLDDNRTLDLDGNSLIIDVNTGDIDFTDSGGAPASYINMGFGNLELMGLTFPASDGTNKQVLKTNGSGTLSFVDPANLGNTNLTLSASRTLTMGNNALFFTKTTGPYVAFFYNGGTYIYDSLELTSNAGQTSAPKLKLLEAGFNGTSYISLSAPDSLTANTDYVLPSADGAQGDVLATNGSAELSWLTPSGGSSDPIPLTSVSGRFQWASADSGERVLIGSTSYGPFNWYNFSMEPTSTSFRTYSSTDVVDTATENFDGWRVMGSSFPMPKITNKKMRIRYFFRLQNAPVSSTWGFSLWGGNRLTSGTAGTVTLTLRGLSSDITVSSNTSTVIYSGIFTTTSNITEDDLVFLAENRSGTLTTTVYMIGQWSIEIVN